jgi:hypothetical protein
MRNLDANASNQRDLAELATLLLRHRRLRKPLPSNEKTAGT